MRSGFTTIELLLVCIIVGAATAIAVPFLRQSADRMAVRRAGTELIRFYREARSLAVRRSASVSVHLDSDSLVGILGTSAAIERRGPAAYDVELTVTRAEFAFGPAGIAWGPANTRLTLRRGAAVDEYVTSRLGRLRRLH